MIHYFSVLALTLGLVRIFGNFTGVWIFSELGRALAISPNPAPYVRVDRIAPSEVNQQLAFSCEEDSRPLSWHSWDYQFRATIPGPHRRTITFLNFFALAQNSGKNSDQQKQFEKMNEFYFCHGGPLAVAAGCGDHVREVCYRWGMQMEQGTSRWLERRQPCSL